MSSSIATFRQNVLVEGILNGQTIVRLDQERTAVQNALNQHITDYNNSEVANATERATIVQSIQDLETSTTQGFTDVNTTINDNKTDIEGKLATETSARLSLQSDFNNRNTFIDSEIVRLDQQHTDDDARLTAVEQAQATVNTDIEQKIQDRIDAHNADLDNTLPRLSKLEEYFVVDESGAEPVVRIKAGVQFEVSGDFIHG